MVPNLSPYLRSVAVPRSVIAETLSVMQTFGREGCEALVLWLGQIDTAASHAEVITAFLPKQNPIKGEDGVGYFVTGETLFHLNRGLSETGLRLIAQVHSHPTEAFHSEADDRYAIVTAEGGLSLVVPDFGHAPADPTTWAVYRLEKNTWCELAEQDSRTLFVIRER
jgi:hypothetical protein